VIFEDDWTISFSFFLACLFILTLIPFHFGTILFCPFTKKQSSSYTTSQTHTHTAIHLGLMIETRTRHHLEYLTKPLVLKAKQPDFSLSYLSSSFRHFCMIIRTCGHLQPFVLVLFLTAQRCLFMNQPMNRQLLPQSPLVVLICGCVHGHGSTR
jgi:hypothetical protein